MMAGGCLLAFFLAQIFLLRSSSAQSVLNSCVCGQANAPITRIVNGVKVVPNKYPWMAAMISPKQKFMCGGAIISDQNILTAGHCLFYVPDVLKSQWVLGMHSKKKLDGVRYQTQSYDLHPNFENNSMYDDFDIAIVTVDRKIVFNTNIKPICLTNIGDDFTGKMVTVAGWGKLGEKTTKVSDELMETKVLHESVEKCTSMTEPLIKFNPESMICAYAKGTDACQGDSGGPLFIESEQNRYTVFAVVSFGDGCARPFPGIYGKLGTSLTHGWIMSTIAQTSASLCSVPPARKRRMRVLVPPQRSYRVLPLISRPVNYYFG